MNSTPHPSRHRKNKKKVNTKPISRPTLNNRQFSSNKYDDRFYHPNIPTSRHSQQNSQSQNQKTRPPNSQNPAHPHYYTNQQSPPPQSQYYQRNARPEYRGYNQQLYNDEYSDDIDMSGPQQTQKRPQTQSRFDNYSQAQYNKNKQLDDERKREEQLYLYKKQQQQAREVYKQQQQQQQQRQQMSQNHSQYQQQQQYKQQQTGSYYHTDSEDYHDPVIQNRENVQKTKQKGEQVKQVEKKSTNQPKFFQDDLGVSAAKSRSVVINATDAYKFNDDYTTDHEYELELNEKIYQAKKDAKIKARISGKPVEPVLSIFPKGIRPKKMTLRSNSSSIGNVGMPIMSPQLDMVKILTPEEREKEKMEEYKRMEKQFFEQNGNRFQSNRPNDDIKHEQSNQPKNEEIKIIKDFSQNVKANHEKIPAPATMVESSPIIDTLRDKISAEESSSIKPPTKPITQVPETTEQKIEPKTQQKVERLIEPKIESKTPTSAPLPLLAPLSTPLAPKAIAIVDEPAQLDIQPKVPLEYTFETITDPVLPPLPPAALKTPPHVVQKHISTPGFEEKPVEVKSIPQKIQIKEMKDIAPEISQILPLSPPPTPSQPLTPISLSPPTPQPTLPIGTHPITPTISPLSALTNSYPPPPPAPTLSCPPLKPKNLQATPPPISPPQPPQPPQPTTRKPPPPPPEKIPHPPHKPEKPSPSCVPAAPSFGQPPALDLLSHSTSVNDTYQPNPSFYRRHLDPSVSIHYNSPRGRVLFQQALANGTMEPFFPLSEQFTTQSEPAYCALSTLAMALNAMSVDPIHKMWKKPWRWYTDDLLACCYPLQSIAKGGMTFEQFSNLSRCHGLYVDEYYASDVSIDNLRAQIKEYCSTPTAVLEGFAAQPATGVNLQRFVSQDVFEGMSKNGEYHLGNNSTGKQGGLKRTMCISYSRSSLKQTGDGHVSPLGGYNEEYDSVLIFDVARFKYPPYWVTVEDLYKSMLLIDPVSERSRGFSFLSVIDDGKREQKKGVNTITSGAGILNDNISKAAPNSAVTQVVVNKIGTGNPSTAFSSVITPIDNFANSDDKNDANVVSNKPSHESTHVDQTKGVSMEGNTLRSANMAHQQRIPQQQREMLENMQNDKNHSPQIIFAKTHPRKLQIIINRSDDSSGSDHDEYKANSIKSVQNNNREPNMNNNSDNFINMNNDLDSEEIELENLYKQRQQELQSSPHPPQKAQNVNSPNIRQLAQAQARAEQQSKQTDPQYTTRTIYYVPEHIQHQDPNRFSQNGDIFFKPNQNLQHFSQIFPPQISHLQNGFFSNALQHSDVNNAQCPPKIMSWFFRPPKQRF